MVDTAKLTGERLGEFERDQEESNRRYDRAFEVVLSHTSVLELEEFWKLLPPTVNARTRTASHADFEFSNPIFDGGSAQESADRGRGWSKGAVQELADLGESQDIVM